MKKDLLKKFISTVLSFAVAVFTAVSILLLCVSLIFSKPLVRGLVKSEKYVSAVRAEVLLSLESYAIPGGLPQDFFEEKITPPQIKSDIARAVECAFSGTEPDFEELRAALKNQIVLYAEENGIKIEEAEDNINNLVALSVSAYRNFVFSVLLKYACAFVNAIFPWSLLAFAVFAVLGALLSLAVKKIGTFYLRCGLSGGALMLLIFPLYIIFSGSVSRLGLTSESMFFLSTSLIYALLFALVLMAVAVLILANINYKKLPKE